MTSLLGALVLATLFAAATLRQRKQLARLETLIRDARALALTEITYEPVDARWRPTLDGLDVPPGMQALGDFVEHPVGRSPSGALRAFADPEGTTFGWLARAATGAGPVVGLVMSTTPDDVYITRHTPARGGQLSSAPWAHTDDAPYLLGLPAAIERHRARIASAKGLTVIRTLDDMQAELRRLRTKTIAWRQAQAPQTLLDRDLRSILGAKYDALGPKLAAKLGVEVPEARVVK
ncbi:MAG: hypothetical protein JO257_23915 [Deltaproteobacteria bacterium]|nr:hypothetical protein [Deltaproteobacteria bacterium]